MLKLRKFRVTNFRSVKDSGWVDAKDTTALIGINESGKSNLLIPLWKLNPAKGGEIKPISDYPRSMYNDIRTADEKPRFIEAEFELSDKDVSHLVSLTGAEREEVRLAIVSRCFAGKLYVNFPNGNKKKTSPAGQVSQLLKAASDEIGSMTAVVKAEESIKEQMLKALEQNISLCTTKSNLMATDIGTMVTSLTSVDVSAAGARSTIAPRFGKLLDDLKAIQSKLSKPTAQESQEARTYVAQNLPKFVYYSNYGNLDSEIYLPHVIENLKRNDLGPKEEAKARTLKVLFDFVKLEPSEILELGKEVQGANPKQLEEISEKKRERDVLLQSASTQLTQVFRDWWKQGDYRFRLAADGNHFRIWVSDDKRPVDIELECRSTGLQWFLSFFLVFLVEAEDSHEGAVLLLDEPGLTLHPLAQKDLIRFFDSLSDSNQIVFSTHSPFLVDSNNLDGVTAVYIDDNGHTTATSDLRSAAPKTIREKSIYAAHAALGLTVSDVILQGCQPVVVEGPSDQIYLSAMKNYLIGKGAVRPNKELVFLPAGGAKSIKTISTILSAKDDEMPFVLVDSDEAGLSMLNNLKSTFYTHQSHKLLEVSNFTRNAGSEIEDMFPVDLICNEFSRLYPTAEDIQDHYQAGRSITTECEKFARSQGLQLPTGWKVELAKKVKKKLESGRDPFADSQDLTAQWTKLFESFGVTEEVAVTDPKSLLKANLKNETTTTAQ